jgi:glutathione S-transferase
MKIYGHPQSSCTRKVLLALAEKGGSAELCPVDLAAGRHKRREHVALHPYGKVPVLEHEGFVLYESPAIIRYLDQLLPGVSLVPSELHARARMDQWLSVEACYVAAPTWLMRSQLIVAPMFGQQPDPVLVERGRRELCQTLDLLDRALSGRSYLAGESFSLAEVSYMPCLQFLEEAGQHDLIEARPSLTAWWRRLRVRASWRRVLTMPCVEAPCVRLPKHVAVEQIACFA